MDEGSSRCIGFSDGVFAIAATLLILAIQLPPHKHDEELWATLASLWPSYLAFALSFLVILVTWVNHHDLMQLVRTTSRPFLLANGLVLLYVTFLPFPTAVLAEHLAGEQARSAATFYCGTFVAGNIAWNLLLASIKSGGLYRADVDTVSVQAATRSVRLAFVVMAVTTLIATVWPALALFITFLVRIHWLGLRFRRVREATAA